MDDLYFTLETATEMGREWALGEAVRGCGWESGEAATVFGAKMVSLWRQKRNSESEREGEKRECVWRRCLCV